MKTMRTAGRYVRALWKTLPLLFWCCIVPEFLIAYLLVVYLPVIMVVYLVATVLPRTAKRAVAEWMIEYWIPQAKGMGYWWSTNFRESANRLWIKEFGQEFPPFDK